VPYADPARRRQHEAEYNQRPHVRARRQAGFARYAAANRERLAEAGAEFRLRRRASCLIATTRTRARKRGLAFDLDQHRADIQARIDRGACELTGEPFDLSPGRKFNSPSLDRINPARGYTHDNVRVVLNLVNAALGDWGEATLADVMRRWLLR
jgi:hypothetical protein